MLMKQINPALLVVSVRSKLDYLNNKLIDLSWNINSGHESASGSPEVNTARPIHTNCFHVSVLSYLVQQHWSTLNVTVDSPRRHFQLPLNLKKEKKVGD